MGTWTLMASLGSSAEDFCAGWYLDLGHLEDLKRSEDRIRSFYMRHRLLVQSWAKRELLAEPLEEDSDRLCREMNSTEVRGRGGPSWSLQPFVGGMDVDYFAT